MNKWYFERLSLRKLPYVPTHLLFTGATVNGEQMYIFETFDHMWLVSQGNPYVMQETCQCTFLKGFSITNNILAKKKFFAVANFFKWRFLFYLKLAYLPNSDTSIIGHYFHFMVTNSTFHDYIRLLKVVDIMYDKISIDFDGQKWPN